ncbi:hypothetical protein B0T11DRAFT_232105 [Plectosphaerella cucumerina]|uniref:CRIB domain-containing protein n=1 Tax=Plectosphaerella cucumerina TaxID=40658 RepID=A0A8K0WYK1_9PEZI|nr:hypothetical protein B0T11DRAFT_232105 [Plectosphaerella cucumerina]
MFAAAAPLPYYSSYGYSASRSKKALKGSTKDANTDTTSRPDTRSNPSDGNAGAMLEPAIEGPPSSEKIRALNKQVQRASAANSSSQPSSLRSFATDSPSWEQTLEHVALSRHSSQRSTSSSMPSRPESVQLFGKTIFSRRSKARRESSANSSSGSSLYSGEVPLDAPAQSSKEQYVSGIFGRIKGPKIDTVAARARSNSAASRKLQISGPYNFQHVSHSRRDQPHVSPGRGQEPPSPAQQPQGVDVFAPHGSLEPSMPVSPRGGIPQPPPRSPADLSPTSTSPPVPPRMSSRMSARPDAWDAAVSDRPSTSGGFRQPQPFTIAEDTPAVPRDVVGSQPLSLDTAGIPLHAITTPGDAAWPLPSASASFSYEAALADVPEEEEHVAAARRSRLSLASNSSSLRGSQSVPLLRLSAQLQAAARQRPPSGASDTLGRFDVLAARRASKGVVNEDPADSHARESWEDDIDYCYEHEAEADCNFVWERPSLELVREESGHTSYSYLADDVEDYMGSSDRNMTSLMPVPATHFDMPVFGSVSPGLGGSSSQMVHPTMGNSTPVTFKESHGFNLSPSLLIPGDFQRQMSLSGSGSGSRGTETRQDDAVSPTHVDARHAETSPAALSPGERHISTNSNFTAPTRYTGSTTFEGWDPKVLEASEPLPSMQYDDATELASPKSFTAPRSPLSEPGDMMSHSTGDIRDELSKPDDMVQHPTKPRHRRQRANTTSLLNPPAGGYALFPPAYSGNRV